MRRSRSPIRLYYVARRACRCRCPGCPGGRVVPAPGRRSGGRRAGDPSRRYARTGRHHPMHAPMTGYGRLSRVRRTLEDRSCSVRAYHEGSRRCPAADGWMDGSDGARTVFLFPMEACVRPEYTGLVVDKNAIARHRLPNSSTRRHLAVRGAATSTLGLWFEGDAKNVEMPRRDSNILLELFFKFLCTKNETNIRCLDHALTSPANSGLPKNWRRNVPPRFCKLVGAKTERRCRKFGVVSKYRLQSKRATKVVQPAAPFQTVIG